MTNPYAELDKFLETGLSKRFTSQAFLRFGSLKLFTRVATRSIGGQLVRTLDIGRVDTVNERRGEFTRLLNYMERLAHRHGVAIYVESILNEHLLAFLKRRGYEITGEDICPNATCTIEQLNAKYRHADDSPSP